MEPVIHTLPIAVRGWCICDPKTPRKRKKNSETAAVQKSGIGKFKIENRRPKGFVCLGEPPEGAPPLLGVVLFGVIARWRITQEILVYPNDIELGELKALEQYVRERASEKPVIGEGDEPKTCFEWSGEPDVQVSLISLFDFQQKFWAHAL